MDIGSFTHVGNVRKANEDALAVYPKRGLFVVADGMGGHAGGAMASALACERIPESLEQGKSLDEAILEAHEAVLNHPISLACDMRSAPGTTVVVAQVDGLQAKVAWMGDSRIYLWRKRDGREQLLQVSKDHSLVQILVDKGEITEEQARTHPNRNIISQVLGMRWEDPILPDVRSLTLAPGERLLLCTDGLNGEITDEQIKELLGNTQRTAQQVCEELVVAALEAGGHDNVTVVVVGV